MISLRRGIHLSPTLTSRSCQMSLTTMPSLKAQGLTPEGWELVLRANISTGRLGTLDISERRMLTASPIQRHNLTSQKLA